MFVFENDKISSLFRFVSVFPSFFLKLSGHVWVQEVMNVPKIDIPQEITALWVLHNFVEAKVMKGFGFWKGIIRLRFLIVRGRPWVLCPSRVDVLEHQTLRVRT